MGGYRVLSLALVALVVMASPPRGADASQAGREPGERSPDAQSITVPVPPAGPLRDGWRALEAGKLQEAEEAFERARRDEPNNPLAYLGLGIVADRRGASAQAEQSLVRALELAPELTAASIVLGEALYERGDVAAAIRMYEDALAHAPGERRLAARLDRWKREAALHARFLQAQGNHFTVLFEGPAEDDLARQAVEVLEAAYDRVGTALLTYPLEPITVVLYTREQFRDITRSPKWSGGVFDGRIRVPVQGAEKNRREFERVLTHEFTHALVGSVAPSGVPTWLNEGLAGYFEQDGVARALADRQSAGRWLRLSDLAASFALPRSEADVRLAYAQSTIAVQAMIERTGAFAVMALISDLADGASFDRAFAQRMQMSFDDFERDLESAR